MWEEATATATFLMDSVCVCIYIYIYIYTHYTYTLWGSFAVERSPLLTARIALLLAHPGLFEIPPLFLATKKLPFRRDLENAHFPRIPHPSMGNPPWPCVPRLSHHRGREGFFSLGLAWPRIVDEAKTGFERRRKNPWGFLDFQVVHWLGHLLFVITEHKQYFFPYGFS